MSKRSVRERKKRRRRGEAPKPAPALPKCAGDGCSKPGLYSVYMPELEKTVLVCYTHKVLLEIQIGRQEDRERLEREYEERAASDG